MLMENPKALCEQVIRYCFYTLFAIVPIIFIPLNFELFEFNKMWATYIVTIVILAAWLIKILLEGRITLKRTPLDIPILLFLLIHVFSTISSLDPHTSLFGYYSRFNGGLLSIFSYSLLYFAFVNHLRKKEEVLKIVKISLTTGGLVAVYGFLEHFGIDAEYWVQDVKNRVFSTLGQPNWLAAYLSILLPISIALVLQERRLGNYFLLTMLYYTTLLFTKSRSGFLGLFSGLLFFVAAYLWLERKHFPKLSPKMFLLQYWYALVVLVLIGSITFLVGSPFEKFNRFTFDSLRSTFSSQTQPPPTSQGPALEIGGTESSEIRRIVWKGAIDIVKAYPLLGSGVETFAYAYYRYRPASHNLTSEWDFLYNKAHNEYLNYLATTGLFGLGSYLAIIGIFLSVTLKYLLSNIYSLALLSSYISILVSNFFGFSVVTTNLYFFTIPAMVFLLNAKPNPRDTAVFLIPKRIPRTKVPLRPIAIVLILFLASSAVLTLTRFWLADKDYATALRLTRSGKLREGYEKLHDALRKRSDEPVFRDELAQTASILATAFFAEGEATASSHLVNEAIALSSGVTQDHRSNPTFWKNQARIFYTLSAIDETYTLNAVTSLEKARELSPTDPKISYNLALLYEQTGYRQRAITTLEETITLKPDYRDANFALGLFYDDTRERGKAIEQMDFILQNIASDDAEAIEKLLEWRGY